jgi:arylsulfatase A-like enzyme
MEMYDPAQIPLPAKFRPVHPFDNGDMTVRDYLLTAYKPQRAVRTDRWKLIRCTHISKTQLFDLQTDPRETNDPADKPEHAGKVEEMMARLAQAQKQWGDTCPLVSPSPASPEWSPPVKEPSAPARRARRSGTK